MPLNQPLLLIAGLVSLIYLAISANYWRKVTDKQLEYSLIIQRSALFIGLVLHGFILYQNMVNASTGLNLNLFNALSLILWLTVFIYWLTDFFHNLTGLQAFVLPPAAVGVLLPLLSNNTHVLDTPTSLNFIGHISIAMLAYALFTFAAMHAVLMSIAERTMHHRKTMFALPSFPPLMVMESILFKTISVGFLLLTFTLISGMFFSEELFGKAMPLNHKTIFSMLSWLIYAGLLYGHYQYGWRGLKAIRWTLVGFTMLLLAYVGSKFILEVVLQRS